MIRPKGGTGIFLSPKIHDANFQQVRQMIDFVEDIFHQNVFGSIFMNRSVDPRSTPLKRMSS